MSKIILQSCSFHSHKLLSAYISVSINSGPGLGNKGAGSSLLGLPYLRSIWENLGKIIFALFGVVLDCIDSWSAEDR